MTVMAAAMRGSPVDGGTDRATLQPCVGGFREVAAPGQGGGIRLSINHVLRGDAHIQQGVTSLPAPADSCQSRLAPSSSGFPNCEMRKQEQLTPRLKDKPSPKLPG